MVETAAQVRIFISYRREETEYPAGWLFNRLTDHFPKGQVFKDIDSIAPGDVFPEVITEAVGSCHVLLALIGSEWLTITDAEGRRRIDNPGDFVRLEIEAALKRNVRVVPVLIGGARMPGAEDLPESLAGLSLRHALELSASHFDFETARLFRVLDESLAEEPPDGGGDPTEPAADEPAERGATGDRGPEPEPKPPPAEPLPLGVTICAIAGALLLGVGVFARWDTHKGGRSWFDLQFGDAGAEHAAVFTALSPLVLVLGAFAALTLALRPRTRDLGAGLLIGFGIAGTAKYVGVLRGTFGNGDEHRSDAPPVFAAVIVGALLLVAAGVLLARRGASAGSAAPLGIVAGARLRRRRPDRDRLRDSLQRRRRRGHREERRAGTRGGGLSIRSWSPRRRSSRVVLLTSGRRLLAAGLLIAFGSRAPPSGSGTSACRSSSTTPWRSFGAGGLAGLAGGLLLLTAGVLVWRQRGFHEPPSARRPPCRRPGEPSEIAPGLLADPDSVSVRQSAIHHAVKPAGCCNMRRWRIPRRSAAESPKPARLPGRLLAAMGLVALLGGMAVVVLASRDGQQRAGGLARDGRAAATRPKPKPKPRPAAPVKIVVSGVGAYDPEGDRSENNSAAGLATDGIASTAWKTEHYRSTFHKAGVGLVLDAGRPVRAARVVVTTETPGYNAQVHVGNSESGPFVAASPSKRTTAPDRVRPEAEARPLPRPLDHVDAGRGRGGGERGRGDGARIATDVARLRNRRRGRALHRVAAPPAPRRLGRAGGLDHRGGGASDRGARRHPVARLVQAAARRRPYPLRRV